MTGVLWNLEKIFMRGLAQAEPGIWWATLLSACYHQSVSRIKKIFCQNSRVSSLSGFPGQDLGCVNCYVAHLGVHYSWADVSIQYVHHGANQVSCCISLWSSHSWSDRLWDHMTESLRMTLGEFLRAISVWSHCSVSSMLVLWLIPFICVALDSVHRAFMCLVSFDLCSYPGRPADQIILFPFYAWESQAWGVYDLPKVTKLLSARPSNRCARSGGAIQSFPIGWYAAWLPTKDTAVGPKTKGCVGWIFPVCLLLKGVENVVVNMDPVIVYIWILLSSLVSCVHLKKLINLSVPQFLHM